MNTFLISVGPIFSMKASQQEKDLQAEQAKLYETLTGLFQQQFATQKGTLDFLMSNLKPLIENPQGYSPDTLTAMRTSASDTIAGQYQAATKAMQNRSFVLGGRQLPSGVQQAQQEQLNASQAATESQAQNAITRANESLKLSNFWNAISALSGVGGMQNPAYLLSGANQAGQSAFQSSYLMSQQNNTLGNILGGGLGGALLGGLSTMGSGMPGLFGKFLSGMGG